MIDFEKKYGISEDEKIRTFHQSRRMFCVHEGVLIIAEEKLPYSHAVWFEKEGWISRQDDRLMDTMVRGIIDAEGNVYFYVGYDFQVDNQAEIVFFSHLSELSEELHLKPNAKIFGGLIKQDPGKPWLPRKEYDEIEIIKRSIK